MPRGIFDVMSGWGRTTSIWWVEAKVGSKQFLQCIGQPPTAKNHPVRNVNSEGSEP